MCAQRLVGFALAGMIGLLSSGAATSQEKKAKEDYKVTLYEHGKFGGKSQVCRQESADLRKVQFGNKASSIKWHLPAGKAAVLYADKGFKRPVLVLVGDGELTNLAKDVPNAQDNVASINFLLTLKDTGYPKGIAKDIPKHGEAP